MPPKAAEGVSVSSPTPSRAGGYIHELMATLKRPGRRSQHYNVLQHLAGYLEPHLSGRHKTRLAAQLDAYHQGGLSLSEAIDALKTQFDRFPHPLIRKQVYLCPYPHSLLWHISDT